MGIPNEVTMKKCLVAAFCCFNALMLQPVQAGDGHGGWRSAVVTQRGVNQAHGWAGAPAVRAGWHGGYHGGHRGGHRHHWVGPVVAAALLGTAVYAAQAPVYATPVYPPVVLTPPPQVAYYCSAYQQYYPSVPTCPVPWQPVPY